MKEKIENKKDTNRIINTENNANNTLKHLIEQLGINDNQEISNTEHEWPPLD